MKDKIAIYGAGAAGEWLLDELIREQMNGDVIGFIDGYSSKKQIKHIPIYSPEEYVNKFVSVTDTVIIAAGRQKAVCDMIKYLRENHISNIFLLHDIPGKRQLPLIKNRKFLKDRVRRIRFSADRPTLPYIEMPIVNACNLNCKGCLFLCNASGDCSVVPKETVIKDLKRMKELFEDIPWIRILGGEPLLHKDLVEILTVARQIFSDSEIDICTNGLLIPKLGQEIYQSLREQRIVIHISGYDVTYQMKGEIISVLEKERIPFCFLERSEFAKFYSTKDTNNAEYNFRNCITSSCHELYKGKITTCSGVIAFDKMNKQFNTKYKLTEGKDYFDIHSNTFDAWKVLNLLENPIPACRYCNVKKMQSFTWKIVGKNAALEDYIVD